MKKFVVSYDQEQCAVIPANFSEYKIGRIITSNDEMIQLIEICLKVAKSEAPVLITGESGVGKELVAELIHNHSNRAKESFVKVNCAAVPSNLKESEFFGYEPGSFTGASRYGKKGLIESAQNGTLFLDEIGEMPPLLQSTLLRVLQDGKFARVGGIKEIKANIRILCATNSNLETLVEAGAFRNDLYFRLNVIPVSIPPLSQRREDIPLLSVYFIECFNRQYNMQKRLSKEMIEALTELPWTGNVRELKNTIERLTLISSEEIISSSDLKYIKTVNDKDDYIFYANQEIHLPETDHSLRYLVERYEQNIIERSVEKYGSIRKAAKALQVNPSTLSRKISKKE